MTWLVPIKKEVNPQTQLFCFSHAGSGASTFYPWAQLFPPGIAIYAIQLPGHENRIGEPLSSNWKQLISSVTHALTSEISGPYAIFGHSMGSLLAYAVAQKVKEKNGKSPSVLFFSGRNPPSEPSNLPPISGLADSHFVMELIKRYGALHIEALLDPELKDIYLPILRNDLRLVETYVHDGSVILDSPFQVYYGQDDSLISLKKMQEWQKLTIGGCNIRRFKGGHFYYISERDVVIKTVITELLKIKYPP